MPFNLVIAPFGLLFGVLATETGLSLAETIAMSALVTAGAAQFVALQLLAENAPVILIILTGLAVNLRMLMYSASMAPHLKGIAMWRKLLMAYTLVDQTYGLAIRKFEEAPETPALVKSQYFLGAALAIVPVWYAASVAGALVGSAIPPEFALDFAVPITFIALFAPLLRSLPHIAAAFVATVASLLLVWVPFSGGVMIGGLLGMVTGAAVEWLAKRHG